MRRMDLQNVYVHAGATPNSPELTEDEDTLDEMSEDELEADDIIDYDTETSHYTTISDRERRRNKAIKRTRRRERWSRGIRIKSLLTLPLFRDSKKKDAITYVDWCRQVQTLIDRQILAKKVLDLVMEALEGPPKSDALSEYYEGNKSLEDILGVLDKVYGGQTSYIAL